jgi:hypothetical protein
VLEDELSFRFFPPNIFLNTDPREDFFRWGFSSFETEGMPAIEVREALWSVGGGGGSCEG